MTNMIADSEKIHIRDIRNLDDLESYAHDWNRLALKAPQKSPMASHAYVSTYFRHFLEPHESWFCLLALRGQELMGVLPVVIDRNRHLGFDAPLLRTPFNLHVASVDFLTAENSADHIMPLLLEGLDISCKTRLGLELLRISASSPTVPVLEGSIKGATVIREFNGRESFIDATGSFEEYRASLKRNFSRNLTKAHNKIAKLPNVKTVFLVGEDADPKEIETLMKVEAAGWKGEAGTAIESSELTKSFYADLVKRLSELGWLEWHILYTDNRPIAMHLAMKLDRTLIINKIGFDEEFAKCSPGNILFEKTVQRAFESEDTDEIDCITDMAWHDNWRMIKKDYFDFWIYPRRPIPMIFGVLPKKARRLGRRIPAVKPLYRWIRSITKGA
jgi:hypothetical protein